MSVVVLNAGSSSVKFGVYALDPASPPRQALRGRLESAGDDVALKIEGDGAEAFAGDERPGADAGPEARIAWLLNRLSSHPLGLEAVAVGHRIVHGGADFAEPVIVTPEALDTLDALSPLAPLHQPFNLAGVRAATAAWPTAAQIACFDTAFHRSQPRANQLFALPRRFADEGVLRYGFHGLSYEYIARTAPKIIGAAAHGRLVVAHLGAGASLCAIASGRSVASTMGFTALDGLPMGTRCGAIDPGLILHLIEAQGMSPAEVAQLLNKRSGLLGLSGLSADMRVLEASDDPAAAEAIDYFVRRCARGIAEMTAELGGLDALVFTAGIGEHAAGVRAGVIGRLSFLGFELDADANARHGPLITMPEGSPSAWVIPTDEEGLIAREAARLAAAV